MPKILVVDDVPDNIALLSFDLKDRGYEVLTASNGLQGLAVAASEYPDVILLDVMMPQMSGTEVCRRLKGDPKTSMIPVILVTAMGLDDNVVAGLDAMPAGGKLIIRTDTLTVSEMYADVHPDVRPGTYARIIITDTGCGMPPEVKQRIFEPFFTTKEVGKGTGLGLAMVYGVVTEYDGAVHVYSEPGDGTTFRIYLPLQEAVSGCAETPTEAPQGGIETILVAEDEPLVRRGRGSRTASRPGESSALPSRTKA